jgi:hypothetical protein
MSDTATNVCCRRCNQRLAVERQGALFVGIEAFEQPIRLRCRICAHETTWLPPRARVAPEVKVAEQPEVRASRAVKGLWHREAA